jgi:hypothetical protein
MGAVIPSEAFIVLNFSLFRLISKSQLAQTVVIRRSHQLAPFVRQKPGLLMSEIAICQQLPPRPCSVRALSFLNRLLLRIHGACRYNAALLNRLVFENLRYRPVRTLLSILAIGIEVTMILTLVESAMERWTRLHDVLVE